MYNPFVYVTLVLGGVLWYLLLWY